jgi:hypothetical protein
VRDHQRGLFVFAPKFNEHLLQLEPSQRVEHSERLIQQKHFRRERKGARDAHALAHALRKLSRFLVHRLPQPHDTEIIFCDLATLRFARGKENLIDAEHDVLERRHPGEQARRLKHHATIWSGTDEFLAGENDSTSRDVIQSSEHREHRGLTAARMPDERDEFALLNLEVEILDDDRRAFRRGVNLREV